MKLIVDDTPTGYAIKAVLNYEDSPFDGIEVLPYNSPLPTVRENTFILGNFNFNPKYDENQQSAEKYWYFPSYAPKSQGKHTYFTYDIIAPVLFFAFLNKSGVPLDTTLAQLCSILETLSGKKLKFRTGKYNQVMDYGDKVLTYADLYKEEASREVIAQIINSGKSGSAMLDMIIANTQANNQRYIDDRVNHVDTCKIKAHYSKDDTANEYETTVNMSAVSADSNLNRVAIAIAEKSPEHEPFIVLVNKGNFVTVVSDIFEDLLPYFGDDFNYQGSYGVYTFFMSGLRRNVLFEALKEAFQGE